MKIKRKKGHFSISAVAKMFSVHQQTIRLYEKQGFIKPKRSEGNTRIFTEDDTERLEEIIYLTHQVGINLAGVEMILKLKKQIQKMQKDMNKLFDQTTQELEQENEKSKTVIKETAHKLAVIKQTPEIPHESNNFEGDDGNAFDVDNWEIEYEDD